MEWFGIKVVELYKLLKCFGNWVILDNFFYNFNWQECFGIVGNNGMGKIIFLNILQDFELVDGGKVVIGEIVQFGYYSQELIWVDDDKKVIDVICDIVEFILFEKG